jgi:hypothetical protein
MWNCISRGAIVLLACFAASAFAQTVSMTLENAGAGYVMGSTGVYTSPYGISINGGPTTSLICDDFTTDISLGQTWTATVTSLAALQAGTEPSGTPKFTPAPNAQVYNYAVAAVLAEELVTLPNLASEAAGELSYALWGVFDTTLLNSTVNPDGTLSQTELDAAKLDLSNAQAVVNSVLTNGVVTANSLSMLPSLTIYTPSAPNGLNSSQEFLLVSMAEPSYPVVLAIDLLAVVGLMVVLRRRITGIFN